MMAYDVFVTVGNDRRDFSRLFRLLSKIDASKELSVLVQTGYSRTDDIPDNFSKVDFLTREEFANYLSTSKVVICHAGAGTLLSCLRIGKRPFVLPRLKKYAEHIDDHQLDIFNEFVQNKWCSLFDGEINITESKLIKVDFNDNEMAADIISLGWI